MKKVSSIMLVVVMAAALIFAGCSASGSIGKQQTAKQSSSAK